VGAGAGSAAPPRPPFCLWRGGLGFGLKQAVFDRQGGISRVFEPAFDPCRVATGFPLDLSRELAIELTRERGLRERGLEIGQNGRIKELMRLRLIRFGAGAQEPIDDDVDVGLCGRGFDRATLTRSHGEFAGARGQSRVLRFEKFGGLRVLRW